LGVIDFILHFDRHLLDFVRDYGTWVYGILFAIVFAETGFVVTPFLPGDSLLFAAGALCATGDLSISAMFGLLVLAAFTGNTVNYAVGRFIGARVFSGTFRFLNQAYLERAHAFFERYGGKAIVLARFVPIVRTFVPFVAGAARMTTGTFVLYNAVGAIGWVSLCLGAGWFFGNIPVIKNNFSLVTIGIVFVSVLPMLFELVLHRKRSSQRGAPL
jgi:membrane-associated protein